MKKWMAVSRPHDLIELQMMGGHHCSRWKRSLTCNWPSHDPAVLLTAPESKDDGLALHSGFLAAINTQSIFDLPHLAFFPLSPFLSWTSSRLCDWGRKSSLVHPRWKCSKREKEEEDKRKEEAHRKPSKTKHLGMKRSLDEPAVWICLFLFCSCNTPRSAQSALACADRTAEAWQVNQGVSALPSAVLTLLDSSMGLTQPSFIVRRAKGQGDPPRTNWSRYGAGITKQIPLSSLAERNRLLERCDARGRCFKMGRSYHSPYAERKLDRISLETRDAGLSPQPFEKVRGEKNTDARKIKRPNILVHAQRWI